jgi:c-di-GMP-binding flagellar brake protein YcgR
MGLERRRHPRAPEEMKFAVQGGPLPAGVISHGVMVDISEGGAAFECDAKIPEGQVIAFELRLPIHVTAKIVRSGDAPEGKFRYGMEFVTVEWLDRETLRRYIGNKLGKS